MKSKNCQIDLFEGKKTVWEQLPRRCPLLATCLREYGPTPMPIFLFVSLLPLHLLHMSVLVCVCAHSMQYIVYDSALGYNAVFPRVRPRRQIEPGLSFL